MADLSGYTFWINNPDFRLFKPEEPAAAPPPPTWCEVSQPLVEWGDTLVRNLTYKPSPQGINLDKWQLLDRYCFSYMRALADHRAETNLDNHLCLHQALLEIWDKLGDLALAIGLRELEPPEGSGIQPTMIDAEPEPPDTEYNSIMIGHRMR